MNFAQPVTALPVSAQPKARWKYGAFGPGGGSVPGWVMRAGQIAPFNPVNARHDISENWVEQAVRVPVAYPPGVAQYGPPPLPAMPPPYPYAPSAIPMAPTTPGPAAGVYLGSDAQGRPVQQFDLPGAPTVPQANRAMAALKQMASYMRKKQLTGIAPPLVGGPLSALAKGATVVLRWPNGGVAIQAAL